MSAPYDLTLLTNVTDVLQILIAINTWSNGLFGIFLLVIPSFLFFMATAGNDTSVRMLVTSFFLLVMSTILFGIQLVAFEFVTAFMVLFVFWLLLFMWRGD